MSRSPSDKAETQSCSQPSGKGVGPPICSENTPPHPKTGQGSSGMRAPQEAQFKKHYVFLGVSSGADIMILTPSSWGHQPAFRSKPYQQLLFTEGELLP